MQKIFIIILLSFCSLYSNAQIELQESDSTEIEIKENVVIYKDSRLDVLDKLPSLIAKLDAEPKEKKMSLYKPIVSKDGKKTVTGSIYTNKGFRVVIYNGPDRVKALEAKNRFSKSYAGTPSYMSYNVPSYKIKVGNFESRDEASKFLKRVGSSFPTSFIVPDIITVKNINVQ
ncbi:MAG: SPOR domain-containing protein [Chitinophagaceae bacterium]|nr:SPOR domain-containing protein [Chitinophagaceae bacterium]HMN33334.1 SPOR domain-containing protein [Chitinophagaceae bacterium]